MFIADVGQDSEEEVDAQETSNPGGGDNFGWRLREGDVQTPGVGGPTPTPYTPPILAYDRSVGGTVIGGYVYRGKQIPALQDTYVFGDYLAKKIFTLNYDGGSASNFTNITSILFPTGSPDPLNSLSCFGEDANGELYIGDVSSGKVFMIVPVTPLIRIDSVERNPVSGDFVIHGTGVPFSHVTIKAASNLTQTFTALPNPPMVAGNGTFTYTDPAAGNRRFYLATYP
jgi:hypothetical protein